MSGGLEWVDAYEAALGAQPYPAKEKLILSEEQKAAARRLMNATPEQFGAAAQRAEAVNRPAHYNTGSVECIDAIEASMTPEEFKGYLKGNAQKYLWRYRNKGKPKEDLQKALWYLQRLTTKTE